jgi:hypothetical protein
MIVARLVILWLIDPTRRINLPRKIRARARKTKEGRRRRGGGGGEGYCVQ